MGRSFGPGGFGGGNGGNNPKDAMCSLPWMSNAKICQSRRRRAVSSGMSVGFGPVVVPEDQQLANERPSGNGLFSIQWVLHIRQRKIYEELGQIRQNFK